MGIRLSDANHICLYDSTMDQALGPVFSTEEEAELFLAWYQTKYGDPRADYYLPARRVLFFRRHVDWHRMSHDEMTGEFNPSVAESLVKQAEREADREMAQG